METKQISKDKVILYSFYRSSSAWRVRIALNLKGIKYEIAALNLFEGDQRNSEYELLNPRKMVPALIIDGDLLIESLPIIEYLEETRPERKLYPSDPLLRQKVRAICEICNSGIQPLQNLKVTNKVEKEYGQDHIAWVTYFNYEGFKALEQLLSKTAGKYCFGDEITAADCLVFPQVLGSVQRFGLSLKEYPTIQKIIDNLLTVQEFIDSLPKNQPDCPEDQR
mmetsp:Transcript_56250/g.64536  ORF Transcript_56250/g.64536 Transcript_56250/m.64536 type:complete len:223 (+) Transcript_56250:1-669(+)